MPTGPHAPTHLPDRNLRLACVIRSEPSGNVMEIVKLQRYLMAGRIGNRDLESEKRPLATRTRVALPGEAVFGQIMVQPIRHQHRSG